MAGESGVSSAVVKYAARGVDAVVSANQRVRKSASKTGDVMETLGQDTSDAMRNMSGSILTAWSYVIAETPALREQMARIEQSGSKVAKSLGTSLVPAVRGLATVVQTAAAKFRALPGPVRSFIAMSLALGSALVVLTTAAVTLSAALLGVSTVLGVSLSTIGMVVAAVALLYVAWKNNFLGIQTVTASVIQWLREKVTAFVAFVRPLWERFAAGLRELWSVHGTALRTEFGATLTSLWQKISWFVQATKPIWKTGLRVLSAVTKATFAVVKTRILTVMDAIVTAVRVGLAVLRGDWKKAGELILGFVDRTTERVRGLVDRLGSIFGDLAASAKRWGKDLISEFISGINAKIARFQRKINDLKSTVQRAISFDRVENDRMAQRWGSDLVDHFAKGMSRKSGHLRSALPSQHPGSFGLQPAGGSGTRTNVNVTVEAGAIQMRGGPTARTNAEKTAENVAHAFEQRFGRRS